MSLSDAILGTKHVASTGLTCPLCISFLQNVDEPLGSAKLTIPALAKKVFAGLRVLHVVSNTGAGAKNSLGREAAIKAVQLANKHITMFTETNQTEFRGWCKGKKVRIGFKYLQEGL